MSGGSFDYLCHADAGNLFGDKQDALKRMADYLDGLGPHAQAVAQRTRKLLEVEDEIYLEIAALAHVWRAVEWFESSDSSREQIFVALGEYKATEHSRMIENGQDLAR